ncbi:MAG: aldo/keto reductase, partial [Bacillota bacterium]|nr:aldo/keto reductase [Bacillota bacterium]
HSPQPWDKVNQCDDRYVEGNRAAWRALEDAYQEGKLRAIGVSNFQIGDLESLMESCTVKPMVDQIELNPGWQQRETVAFCAQHDILIEAWSPLGRGRVLGHPLLAELGEKYRKTPAQICLRWCLDKGYLPLPKSVTPSRIQENLNIFDFALTPEDVARLDALPPFGESGRDPDNVPF